MIQYWQANSSRMINLMIEHAQMVLTSLLIALVIAIVLIWVFLKKKN